MSYNLGNVKGPAGKGIQSITKTGTSGLVDTYTITYSDGTTSSFTVTNGSSGADIVTSWETTLSDSKVPSEKLTKDTLDGKASNSHTHGNLSNDGKIGSSSGKIIVTGTSGLLGASDLKTINNNSLIGSGNIDIQGSNVDIDTSFPSTPSDTHVPSTKLVKNSLADKVDKVTGKGLSTEDYTSAEKTKLTGIEAQANKYVHPSTKQCSYAPDLTNYIQKSLTSGLIKNDGSIDTNTYVDTDDIANNLTTTTAGKVLDARQGKILYDLIAGIEEDMLQ
jgi:hypothetical protein